MYSDFISFHAMRRPDAAAVLLPGGPQISYSGFEADINRVTHALAALDLPPAGRIAVATQGNPYWHWLVLLALARLGHVSCSFAKAGDLPVIAPDAVVAFQSGLAPASTRLLALGEEWWGRVLNSAATARVGKRTTASDPARMLLSSGTTGTPKKVLLSHELLVGRLKATALGGLFPGEERSHVAMGPGTAGGFQGVLRTWWMGGAAILGAIDHQRLIRDRVTGLFLSPAQLAALMEGVPPGADPLPIHVRVTGSAMSSRLSISARLRLASDLLLFYGATETAMIACCPASKRDGDETLAGMLLPWVEAQAVGPSGEPLSPGTTGELRIRNGEMVKGYFEDPEASTLAFRDGWFHPGDIGSVSETGLVRVSGRASEVINIGGQKATPDAIEHRVASCGGIKDVAAFSVAREGTAEELWLAVVAEGDIDVNGIEGACRSLGILRANVIRTGEIPRNDMGKIDRHALKELAGRAASRRLN